VQQVSIQGTGDILEGAPAVINEPIYGLFNPGQAISEENSTQVCLSK
jgi:hypothetical protein